MTVFKYVIPERLDVLRGREIRVTQAAALNDPFELNSYFDVLVSDDVVIRYLTENPLDLTPHLREAYEELPPAAKAQMPFEVFLAFAQQSVESLEGQKIFSDTIAMGLGVLRDVTPGLRSQMAESFRTKIGILSLSEIPDCAPMWAHYAANHRGFVIGFDESHAFFNRQRGPEDEFFHLRKVEYRPPEAFADLTEMDGQRILAAKSPEWSYEREWRMLIPASMATRTVGSLSDPVHLVSFSPTVVRSVIIGAKSSAELQTQIESVLADPDYMHVKLHHATLADRMMRVMFDPPL
jgi:hypothetical protein